MQNPNIHSWSWGPGPTTPFPGGPPVLSTTFPPTGVEPSTLIPGYPPMYGNPPTQTPPDYGQWTAAQLQQWHQWQQWQEKYQQWQAQYGKKYAESLAAIGQNPNVLLPGMPPIMGIPKPVEIPTCVPSVSNPPLPSNTQPVPPPPPDEEKPPPPTKEGGESSKNGCSSAQDNPEELSEAEKTFDIQFKQWEGQFNEWKKQNQDHPDKAQYREYEKKWETWREQLLQRREQMRKKRLSKVAEGTNETSNPGKGDEKAKLDTAASAPAQSKPPETEFNFRNQSITGPLGPFTTEPPKIDNKPQLFDKPPPGVPPPGYNQRGTLIQEKNTPVQSNYPSAYGGFGGGQDKMDANRPIPFANNTNFIRNQGACGGGSMPGGNFDGGQPPNLRFGNFVGGPNEGGNYRLPNPNMEGPRFGVRNYEGFSPRARFGGSMDRNMGANFGPPQRFPGDNYRNERDFGQARFFDGNREAGSQNFGKGNFEPPGRGNEGGDFLQGPPGSCPQQDAKSAMAKGKVPSLFDISVERPLMGGPGNDRVLKHWEAGDRRFDEREPERNDRPWSGNGPWPKGAPSPWIQPWEMEKLAARNLSEPRPWEATAGSTNKLDNDAWMRNVPNKPDVDRAELSGYVGNILAKLGNFIPTSGNVELPDGQSSMPLKDLGGGSDPESRSIWNDGPNQRLARDPGDQGYPSLMSLGFRNQERRGGHTSGNFAKDRFDQNAPNFNRDVDDRVTDFRDKNALFPPRNMDRFPSDSAQFLRGDGEGRFRFESEPEKFDIDERQGGGRVENEGGAFGRAFTKGNPRDDNRNLGAPDRWLGRSDSPFNRYKSREDVDERFGRRGFDRFDRDERNGRGVIDRPGNRRGSDGPFDRFGRPVLNEPVWNPQVFDYSQGRANKFKDGEEFKISTVVDYSHGEKKQTFDYGHGEARNGNKEKFDLPTVIDYGHGVDKDSNTSDFRRDRYDISGDDRSKGNSPFRRRSRSPRGRLRSRSRSPHSRFKRESDSPPFKGGGGGGGRARSRDRMGRLMFRRDRNDVEDKSSSSGGGEGGDGDVSQSSFSVTTVLVEDLICRPGRESRPNKLVFIMRGLPGSGKTYVTKLIKDKEVELGGDPPRILSLDDYFMTEVEKEIIDKETGRKVKTKVLEYEYEAGVESHYRGSLLKAFKKTISDGFFSFIIVDSVNEKTKDYEEMWSFAKQKGFQVYIAEMDNDVTTCTGRNIHKRTEKEIADLSKAWEATPAHYLRLDVRSLLQSAAITEVEMEVVSDTELEKTGEKEEKEVKEKTEEKKSDEEREKNDDERKEDVDGAADADGGEKEKEKEGDGAEGNEEEEEDEPGVSAFVKSRWDQFENSEQNLDRLDGLKRRREGFHATMEDYLQLPDDLDVQTKSAPGKKRVRWADLEERRQQEKMRAIGFVVGQTDWSRMTDPTFGESALTRTKYI